MILISDLCESYYGKKITLYHGTPYYSSMKSILYNGLDVSKSTVANGGSTDMPSVPGLSYLAKDYWNAFRYAIMSGDEPYVYVFKFTVAESDLKPDEDPLGSIIWRHFRYGNELPFDKELLDNIPSELLDKVKNDVDGNFVTNSAAGRELMRYLTANQVNKIVRKSRTATTDQKIYPDKLYKIKRPHRTEIDNSTMDNYIRSLKDYIKDNTQVYWRK